VALFSNSKLLRRKHGFTIVELIVVIAVIGILAAIVTVNYNSIQQGARARTVMSDLDTAAADLELDLKNTGNYPASTAAANAGRGLVASTGTTYQYSVNNSVSPKSYCLTGSNGTISYKIYSNNPTPQIGSCP